MAEPRRQRMTPGEFLEWQGRQDRNYELADGVPVLPLKAMTGATRRHDRVVTNTLFALMRQRAQTAPDRRLSGTSQVPERPAGPAGV